MACSLLLLPIINKGTKVLATNYIRLFVAQLKWKRVIGNINENFNLPQAYVNSVVPDE